jgi:hypothetical protein
MPIALGSEETALVAVSRAAIVTLPKLSDVHQFFAGMLLRLGVISRPTDLFFRGAVSLARMAAVKNPDMLGLADRLWEIADT